jgi:hypothetical protein
MKKTVLLFAAVAIGAMPLLAAERGVMFELFTGTN